MGLDNGAQIIVQSQLPTGGFDCVGFSGLDITYPALVAFSCANTPKGYADQADLKAAFVLRLQSLCPQLRTVTMRCPGIIAGPGGCHAQNQLDCHKLLVLIGDASKAIDLQPAYDTWVVGSPMHRVLPVFPTIARKGVSKLLPEAFREMNVNFWAKSIDESIPSILAIAGLTVENPRIFISYKQADSATFAMQLFDELSHAGFDTFLDHFRISPGVNFQSRLTQELGDKSMMVIIESKNIMDSEWTLYEINTAKVCSLGIFAIHVPDGDLIPGVDMSIRQILFDADFIGNSFNSSAKLEQTVIDGLVERIRSEHDKAIVRRRRILYDSLDEALQLEGVTLDHGITTGVTTVRAHNNTEYVIWLTPRPPELVDFHGVHGHAVTPLRGVVIGLSRLMEPARLEQTHWLADLASLKIIDEGLIKNAAKQIAQGTL